MFFVYKALSYNYANHDVTSSRFDRKCTVDYSLLAQRLVQGALSVVYERPLPVPPVPAQYSLIPSSQQLVLRFQPRTRLEQRNSLGFEVSSFVAT